MAEPGVHNFKLKQGDTFNPTWTIFDSSGDPIDFSSTNNIAIFAVRASSDSTVKLTASSSDGDGRLTLNGEGQVIFNIPSSDTAALSFDKGDYDLQVNSSAGVVTTYVTGKLILLTDHAT